MINIREDLEMAEGIFYYEPLFREVENKLACHGFFTNTIHIWEDGNMWRFNCRISRSGKFIEKAAKYSFERFTTA